MKTQVLRVFLVVVLTVGAYVRADDYCGGSGTECDPFLICDAENLNEIGTHPAHWNKHFILTEDIDLSGYDGREGRPIFNIIGRRNNPFTGVFDGSGHVIRNFTCISVGSNDVALFGTCLSECKIRDLGMEDVDVDGGDGSFVAALVAFNNAASRIEDCYVTGTVAGTDYVGGLAGKNLGDISRCRSWCSVRGRNYVGGLVGINDSCWYGHLSECFAAGPVTGGSYVGGLVGINHDATISNCYATGSVSGVSIIGGLAGNGVHSCGWIATSYSVGLVEGPDRAGGLVGTGSGCIDCRWDTETSRQDESACGQGKTTEHMKRQATFVGWDFDNVWAIEEDVTYPYLRAFSSCEPTCTGDMDGDCWLSPADITNLVSTLLPCESQYYWRRVGRGSSGDMDGDGWLSPPDISNLVAVVLPYESNYYWKPCE